MKIVRIIGGLGNQMFQYALFLSLKRKIPKIKIDISSFSKYNLHNGFELKGVFNISLNNIVATLPEVNKIIDNTPFFKQRRLLGKILFSDPNRYIKRTHFIQPNYSEFYSGIFSQKQVYLDGYWQSESYFNKISNEIRQTFVWSNISKRNEIIAEQMSTENSVSIHIRRFDSPKNLNQLIYRLKAGITTRVPSKNYYLKSMQYFLERIESPKFYIFTDNIPWVKKNIPIGPDHVIIDWNRKTESHWDMFLMTKCKNNIISMSSFSWWGAWLNENPNKIVIAPKKWAARFETDRRIIPKKWLRL